jgi:serine protease AprX
VSNDVGSHFAAKATDDFCLAYAARHRATESASNLPLLSVILEFEWTGAEALVPALSTAHVRPAFVDAMTAISNAPWGSSLEAVRMTRQGAARLARDAFLIHAGAVLRDIERESASAEILQRSVRPVRAIDVCWLNGTVRTVVDPARLAEIASDPLIRSIDTPTPIQPEMLVTIETVRAAGLQRAWSTRGKGVTIGIIDGEIDLTHPDLLDRVIFRGNMTSEPQGHPSMHATAIAGIIGGNGAGREGIAPEATLYNYKVLTREGVPDSDDFYAGIAMQRATEDGVDIVNCSWGAGRARNPAHRLCKAVNEAWTLGMVVVKSAGNEGPGASTMTCPAEARGVIVVGATDRPGITLQAYSSRGPAAGETRPHLVAPGGGDKDDQVLSCAPGGGFEPAGRGTSFAAAHVTGLAALLAAHDPGLTPDTLRDELRRRCRPLSENWTENDQGAGLVNQAAASE